MLKANTLDLGLCALPVDDHAFETVPLFEDELVAILPAGIGQVPSASRRPFCRSARSFSATRNRRCAGP